MPFESNGNGESGGGEDFNYNNSNNNNNNNNNAKAPRSKRVGFVSDFGLVDQSGDCHDSSTSSNNNHSSVSPGHDRQHVWDSETDHMLSYFLGSGDTQLMSNNNNGMPEFSNIDFFSNPNTDYSSHNNSNLEEMDPALSSSLTGGDGGVDGFLSEPQFHHQSSMATTPVTNNYSIRKSSSGNIVASHRTSIMTNDNSKTTTSAGGYSNIGLSLMNSDNEEDEEPMAPPTPKIPQFFSRASTASVNNNQKNISSINGPSGNAHSHSLPLHDIGYNSNQSHGFYSHYNHDNNAAAGGAVNDENAKMMMRNVMMNNFNPAMAPPPNAQSTTSSSSGSSSSSSLSTMANTLVSGGPMLYQQMRQQEQQQLQKQQMYASMMAAAMQQQNHQQQQPISSGESPVSPAAMIGTPENLMLPSPLHYHGLRYNSSSSSLSRQTQQQPQQQIHQQAGTGTGVTATVNAMQDNNIGIVQQQQRQRQEQQQLPHPTSNPSSQQQHMAWLRDINAMAKAGRPQNTMQPIQQQPPMVQQPQQPPMSQQPVQINQPQPEIQGHIPHMAHLGLPFTAFPQMAFYGHAAAAAAAAMQQGKNPAPEESEEKRAKRLERNRESARISRRRKKERLAAAEARVWRTHQKIADERQNQIDKLVPGLRKLRSKTIDTFVEENKADPASIMTAVRETGPNSPIFQAVIDFQFNSLQSSLFPRYQKLWLWLALKEEQYFAVGKEEFAKRGEDEKSAARGSSGKISSKQVGDELVNGTRDIADNKTVTDSTIEGRSSDDPSRSCDVNDAARMWPLFCYEHKFSVDQEDKFLGLHKKIRNTTDVQASWDKSQAAIKASSSLRDAMDFVSRVASNREEQKLVGVLRPDQISKYRQWIVMNHDRCSRSLRTRQKQQTQDGDDKLAAQGASSTTSSSLPASSHQESLRDICLRLERVLRITKSDSHSSSTKE